jgi:cellulose synthase/poly-beta-1,6-N-acetylglucosamine synthase-like glycosyltransferase
MSPNQIEPPNLEEKFAYLKRNRFSFLGIGIISTLMLLAGFFAFAMSNYASFIFLPFILLMVSYLGISYAVGLFSKEFDFSKHRALCDKHRRRFKDISIDIYLPICGEDMNIVLNAWYYVKKISWPGKLVVYVLDDGKSDYAKAKAAEYGFEYIRRADNFMKKSGNLRNAYFQTFGDFILILDADFCARSDMLEELMPYMIEDENICITQSPQYFESASWMNWVERGAGQIQEYFYRFTQVNRNAYGGAICVGTSAIYRRKALDSIGGFRLKEWSEDVWNGFSMVAKGWKIEYIAMNLSKGRCPDTLRPLFNQQYRWACGSLSLAKSKEFWNSDLSLWQKLCYATGMMYFTFSACTPLFILIPAPFVVWLYPEHVFYMNIGFYLPSLLYGTLGYKIWSHYKGTDLDFFKIRLFTYFVNIFALKDTILNTTMGWVATGNKNAKKHVNFTLYRYGVPVIVLLNWITLGAGYVYYSDDVRLIDMLPSILSSLFYGFIFCQPIVRDWLAERRTTTKRILASKIAVNQIEATVEEVKENKLINSK